MASPLEQALRDIYPHLLVLGEATPSPFAMATAFKHCSTFFDHPAAVPCAEYLLRTTGFGDHARMYALQILSRAVARHGGEASVDLQALVLRLLIPGGPLYPQIALAEVPLFVSSKIAAIVSGLLVREFPQRWQDGVHAIVRIAAEHGGVSAETAACTLQV
jgi:hypothetical protein